MLYSHCTMASGSSVSSDQKPAAQGAGLREVRVPRETHRVGSLEYIERKPWKYKTKHRYCKSIPADYLIKVPSSKIPQTSDAADGSPRAKECSPPAKECSPPAKECCGPAKECCGPAKECCGPLVTLEVEVEDGCGCRARVRRVIVERGYAWDGASGPTFDTCGSTRAALVHDVLYQCMRLGYVKDSRKAADKLFRAMLKEGDMCPLRRWLWYVAVRWLGRKASEPTPRKGHRLVGFSVLIAGLAVLGWSGCAAWGREICVCVQILLCSLAARGLDLEALGGWVAVGLCLLAGIVLVRLGYELWKGDSCTCSER